MPGVQEHTSELQSHDNLVCLEFRRVLLDRKSTRLNSSHTIISYAVFCLNKTNARRFSIGAPWPPATPAQRHEARASPLDDRASKPHARFVVFFFMKTAPRNVDPVPEPESRHL